MGDRQFVIATIDRYTVPDNLFGTMLIKDSESTVILVLYSSMYVGCGECFSLFCCGLNVLLLNLCWWHDSTGTVDVRQNNGWIEYLVLVPVVSPHSLAAEVLSASCFVA